MAVEHSTTPKRANACSPVPGRFIAIYPRAFSKLFSDQNLTPVDQLAKGSTFETWIKKIDSTDDVTKAKQNLPSQVATSVAVQNEKKINFGIVIRPSVKDTIQLEASKRGYTISGLVETILTNWLNTRKGGSHNVTTDPFGRMGHGACILEQIAAKEYEIYNTVKLEEYLFDVPGRKLTALRKRLISDYHFMKDVGELFKMLPQDFRQRPLSKRYYILFLPGSAELIGLSLNNCGEY